MEMQKVFDFLRSMGIFFLATADGDQPRVRPMGTLIQHDGKIFTVLTKNKKVYEQLVKNSNVEVTATNGQKWIRLSGKLVLDDSPETINSLLEQNPRAKQTFGAHLEMVAPFYFKDATASICSFTEPPVTYKF